MIKTLKIKIIAVVMSVAVLMLICIFSAVIYFTSSNTEKESIRMMQSAAMYVMHERPDIPAIPDMPDSPDIPDDHGMREMRQPVFTLRSGENGEIIAAGRSYYDLTDSEFIGRLADTVFSSEEENGVIREYSLRYCIINTPMGESAVFTDITEERAMFGNLIKNCIIIFVISLAVIFILSIFLAEWAVKPVDKAWKQQKQFVADASHELKTPLTVIMTNAEMLKSDSFDSEKRRQFSESIYTMSCQMRGLAESLLELARADNGTSVRVSEDIDLSELINDSVLPFEPLFFERSMELNCSTEENIHVKGDRMKLSRTADILLDNAMKYSEPESSVNVDLRKQGAWCILSVSGKGEPISHEELKNIFKRFYRIDKARSMDHSYGLGLSIAESIVSEHEGKIWAESKNGINSFFVRLPLY